MANSYDLTARGATVKIVALDEDGNAETGSICEIDDFADDQDPVTVDDCNTAELFFDANGKSHRRSKLEPIGCHIALIPGSDAEKSLNKFVLSNLSMFGSYSFVNMHVKYPCFDEEVVFYRGVLSGASMGYAATSSGRVRTKNFSFQFTTCGKAPPA